MLAKYSLEQACPEKDSIIFRRCLSQFPTGVAIVATEYRGVRFAMTINSFSSLSLDPPMVLWSMRVESKKAEAFRNSKNLSISILSVEQHKISAEFSKSGNVPVLEYQWKSGVNGAPLLNDAIAHFECYLERAEDIGDHVIFMNRVIRCERFQGEPLIFMQGKYLLNPS